MAITQEDIDRRVAAVKPLRPQMGAGEQFLTGLGGAANQVLFGLPEFIARKVQGDELVNKWIQDRQGAWDVGSTVGGVGSFFIPGGAIAKGLGMGAKALGAGKIAAGLDKAADVIKGTQAIGKSPITQKAIQGVAGALEQGIPRALVEGAQTGDIGQAGQNLLTGAALGGGVGAGLGLLSKGAGALGKLKGVAAEATEAAKKDFLASSGLDTRAFRMDINKTGTGKSAARLLKDADDEMDNLVRFAKKYDLQNPVQRDKKLADIYDTMRPQYQKLDMLAEANPDRMRKAIDDAADEIVDLHKGYGAEAQAGVAKIKALVDSAPDLVSKRQILQTEINRLLKNPSQTAQDVVSLDAAKAIKRGMDKQVGELAKETGDPTLMELAPDYRAMQTFSASQLRDELRIPTGGSGSPTFEKNKIYELLGGGGVGALLGAQGADFENDPGGTLARLAAGTLGGAALSKGLPALQRRITGAAINPLEKLTEKLGTLTGGKPIKIAPNVPGQIGAGAASMADLAGGPVAEAAPEMEQEAVEQDVLGAIFNRLDQKWNSTNAQYYGPADPSNPYYAQWARGAIDQAMPGGQLDPIIAGKILGQNKEQADQIAQALAAARAIKQNVAQAGEMGGGILGIGQSPTEQAQLARQLIQGSLGDVAGKAGVTQKQVDQAVQQILAGGGTMQEKVQKLMQLQSAYNPQTMAYLSQMGAV